MNQGTNVNNTMKCDQTQHAECADFGRTRARALECLQADRQAGRRTAKSLNYSSETGRKKNFFPFIFISLLIHKTLAHQFNLWANNFLSSFAAFKRTQKSKLTNQ